MCQAILKDHKHNALMRIYNNYINGLLKTGSHIVSNQENLLILVYGEYKKR